MQYLIMENVNINKIDNPINGFQQDFVFVDVRNSHNGFETAAFISFQGDMLETPLTLYVMLVE